jgi:hypothetical protein
MQAGPVKDERKTTKIAPEAKRIWDVIAAATDQTRDQAMIAYGREVMRRLQEEGKLA